MKAPANTLKTQSPGGDLHVFLNYACQAKCAFCYNPPLTDELNRWKLPMEALARNLLEHRRKSFSTVTFSGGEVTLIQELPAMIRLARKTGFERIGIISNGIRLAQPEYARELLDCGLNFCCFSVHGADAALHDEIVVVPGAFDKILKALEHLHQGNASLLLNFVLTRQNAHTLPAFIERFASAPVQEFQIYYPHYDGMMALNAALLKISMQEAGPSLERAWQTARSLAVQDKLWFYNFPPCAVPRSLNHRLRNWEKEEDSLLVDPRGIEGDAFRQERRNRVKTAECARCSLNPRCLGFEKGYVSLYGDSEIKAIR